MPKRGWTQRNLALQYLRENYSPDTDGVLYFADDDNSYDVRLFDNYIRKVKRLGIWPVGLVGGAWVEAPRVDKKGKVEGWDVLFAPRREFATDMAGFGLHIKELFRVKNATFEKCTKTAGFGPESCFLTQFGFKKKDAEPFGLNEIPKDILVWHTKTSESRGSGPLRGFVIE
ncbi:glycosyltransferase family 43 [Necator americanus]|nr:glycosyltransferase family 43 [Necator americanus]ETN79463.1 glycosyltransferase family 43 [Necator americanus]